MKATHRSGPHSGGAPREGVAALCGDDPDEGLPEEHLPSIEEELTEVEVRHCEVDNQRWKELVADLSAVETRTLVLQCR